MQKYSGDQLTETGDGALGRRGGRTLEESDRQLRNRRKQTRDGACKQRVDEAEERLNKKRTRQWRRQVVRDVRCLAARAPCSRWCRQRWRLRSSSYCAPRWRPWPAEETISQNRIPKERDRTPQHSVASRSPASLAHAAQRLRPSTEGGFVLWLLIVCASFVDTQGPHAHFRRSVYSSSDWLGMDRTVSNILMKAMDPSAWPGADTDTGSGMHVE